jgi:hypothetical protein
MIFLSTEMLYTKEKTHVSNLNLNSISHHLINFTENVGNINIKHKTPSLTSREKSERKNAVGTA